MAVELKLARSDRVYRPPDVVDGSIIITTTSSISHQGIKITATGTVLLQPSPRSVGVIESLYSSVKPIQLLNKSVDVNPPGKITAGKLEIPFHIALDGPKGGSVDSLYETYHGAYINIQYLIIGDVLRGYLQKNLSATLEIIVEHGTARISRTLAPSTETICFYITQDTQKHPLIPSIRSGGFRVTGRVCALCPLTEPITGEVTVEASAVPISSIDIQLLRVESIDLGGRMASEVTEVQITQIFLFRISTFNNCHI
eukprot:c24405_g1_i1 orf=357-1124(-)